MSIIIEYNGEQKSIRQWAKDLNLTGATLYKRYNNGQRGDALFRPTTSPAGRKPNTTPSLAQRFKRERQAWVHMFHHCYNQKCKAYPQYGGKGIRVCQEWRDFEQFLANVGPRPEGHWCLARHDKSLDYTAQNTAWLPRYETHRGSGVVPTRIDHNGTLLTINQLAALAGVGACTIRDRYVKGLRGEALVASTPQRLKTRFKVMYKGSEITMRQLARATGHSYATLMDRYHKGERDELLIRPSRNKNPPKKRR